MPIHYAPQRDAYILPSDHGLIGWTCDPALLSQTTVMTSGRLVGARIYVPVATTITNILLLISTAGSTLTAGQSFAGLYTDAGVLLSGSADQSTAFASTGTKTIALNTPQAVATGWYRAAAFSVGTTPPTLRGSSSSAVGNVGFATPRFFLADTGLTTALPSPIGTQASANSNWFGLT